ncbi:hypothetical protein VPH35_003500 [Triticum aestivum]
MVHLIGGNFHEKWNRKATHAICNMFDADECDIPIVNHSWLCDSLNAGVILSCDNYHVLVETNFISKPKIARCLQFKSDKKTSLDNYVKPDNRITWVLTTPVLKRVLRKSYLPLGRLHAKNLSLGGNFGCQNFMVSDPHETVELCNVITEELTPEGRKADKKVSDVRVWLHDIEGGWDDALLMNHIYLFNSDLTYDHFITLDQGVLKLNQKGGQKYKDFIELPSMQPYNCWHADGFKWKMLGANKDYTDPRDEQLDILEKARLERKRENNPSRNNVFGLLRTVRNTWSRPAAHLLEFFLAIMITEYLQLLSDLQKALYDCGHYGQNLSLMDFP